MSRTGTTASTNLTCLRKCLFLRPPHAHAPGVQFLAITGFLELFPRMYTCECSIGTAREHPFLAVFVRHRQIARQNTPRLVRKKSGRFAVVANHHPELGGVPSRTVRTIFVFAATFPRIDIACPLPLKILSVLCCRLTQCNKLDRREKKQLSRPVGNHRFL